MKVKIKVKPKKRRNDKDSKTVAKVAMFTKEDAVLLLKRSNYMKKHGGEWDLPGGHLLKNEELLDGLTREVKEETGLDISTPLFVFKDGKDHFFAGEWSNKDLSLSDEHVSFIFQDVSRINDLKSLTSYYKSAILKCYEAFKSNE